MRGEDRDSGALFSYVSCKARVPADHPLRLIRAIVDEALEVLSPTPDAHTPAASQTRVRTETGTNRSGPSTNVQAHQDQTHLPRKSGGRQKARPQCDPEAVNTTEQLQAKKQADQS